MYTRSPNNYRDGIDEGGRVGYFSPNQQHTINGGGGTTSPYRNSPSSNASSSPNSQRTNSNWGSNNSSSRKTSYESNTYTPPNKRNLSNNYNRPPPPPAPTPTTPYDNTQKSVSNTNGGYAAPNNGGMRKGRGSLSVPPPQKPQQRGSGPIGKKPNFVSGHASKPAPTARSGPRTADNEDRSNDNRPIGRFNNNDRTRNGTKLNAKGNNFKAEDGGGKPNNNSRGVQVRPDQNFVPRGMMAPTDGSGQPFAYYPMEGYYSMPVMGSYPYGPGYFPGAVQFQPMGDGLVGWQPGPMYYGYYNQETAGENDDDDGDDDDKAKKESGDEEQED